MYAILKNKANRKHYVGNPPLRKNKRAKAQVVVTSNNRSILQEISQNLNRHVPQMRIHKVDQLSHLVPATSTGTVSSLRNRSRSVTEFSIKSEINHTNKEYAPKSAGTNGLPDLKLKRIDSKNAKSQRSEILRNTPTKAVHFVDNINNVVDNHRGLQENLRNLNHKVPQVRIQKIDHLLLLRKPSSQGITCPPTLRASLSTTKETIDSEIHHHTRGNIVLDSKLVDTNDDNGNNLNSHCRKTVHSVPTSGIESILGCYGPTEAALAADNNSTNCVEGVPYSLHEKDALKTICSLGEDDSVLPKIYKFDSNAQPSASTSTLYKSAVRSQNSIELELDNEDLSEVIVTERQNQKRTDDGRMMTVDENVSAACKQLAAVPVDLNRNASIVHDDLSMHSPPRDYSVLTSNLDGPPTDESIKMPLLQTVGSILSSPGTSGSILKTHNTFTVTRETTSCIAFNNIAESEIRHTGQDIDEHLTGHMVCEANIQNSSDPERPGWQTLNQITNETMHSDALSTSRDDKANNNNTEIETRLTPQAKCHVLESLKNFNESVVIESTILTDPISNQFTALNTTIADLQSRNTPSLSPETSPLKDMKGTVESDIYSTGRGTDKHFSVAQNPRLSERSDEEILVIATTSTMHNYATVAYHNDDYINNNKKIENRPLITLYGKEGMKEILNVPSATNGSLFPAERTANQFPASHTTAVELQTHNTSTGSVETLPLIEIKATVESRIEHVETLLNNTAFVNATTQILGGIESTDRNILDTVNTNIIDDYAISPSCNDDDKNNNVKVENPPVTYEKCQMSSDRNATIQISKGIESLDKNISDTVNPKIIDDEAIVPSCNDDDQNNNVKVENPPVSYEKCQISSDNFTTLNGNSDLTKTLNDAPATNGIIDTSNCSDFPANEKKLNRRMPRITMIETVAIPVTKKTRVTSQRKQNKHPSRDDDAPCIDISNQTKNHVTIPDSISNHSVGEFGKSPNIKSCDFFEETMAHHRAEVASEVLMQTSESERRTKDILELAKDEFRTLPHDTRAESNTVSVSQQSPLASTSFRQSVFMESIQGKYSDHERLVKSDNDKVLSMSFLAENDDDEWLPNDVDYTMNPLLEQLLRVDENESKNTEAIEVELMRTSTGHQETMFDSSIPLPEISDSSLQEEKSRTRRRVQTDMHGSDESDDDSVIDKNYIPSDVSSHSSDESGNDRNSSQQKKSLSKSANSSINISGVLNLSDKAACGSLDNKDLNVQASDEKKSKKKYMCMYCKKMYSKLPRHLQHVHPNEPDVKKFTDLPPGNKERKNILNVLRKTGTFQFNTDGKYNTGEIIPSRRPNPKFQKKGSDYKTCANCLGTYSILNIRHHVAQCAPSRVKTQRSVIVLGRAVEGRLHKDASAKLRLEVFPPLREDDIVRLIRYDRLLIVWGNKLCLRYTPHYQHNMIRARLRLMGRLLLTVREINPNITDFASIYQPKMYDDVVKAARIVSRYDENDGEFGAPSVGMNLGTYIRQIGEILINEYVKSEEPEKERKAEQFLKVLRVDFSVDVNKAALETQRKNQRQRKVVLPTTDDIKTLNTYLKSEMQRTFENLSESYSFAEWFKLAELTVASLVAFNRRRTGDIQNILVEDYANQDKIDEKTDKELYASLSAESKAVANKYVRIAIRGKKGRTVPVLLFPQLVKNIDLILKYRSQAKVGAHNKFLFGLPSTHKTKIKVVDACEAMRKYSRLCGAKLPETLRGTQLRKHIATQCVTFNLNDNEVTDLANFMGHAEKIHKEVYRQPIKSREILGISRLLETAQGEDDDSDRDSNFDDFNDNDDNSQNERKSVAEKNDNGDADEGGLHSNNTQSSASSINKDFELQGRSSPDRNSNSPADISVDDSPRSMKRHGKRRANFDDPDFSVKRKRVLNSNGKGKKEKKNMNTGKKKQERLSRERDSSPSDISGEEQPGPSKRHAKRPAEFSNTQQSVKRKKLDESNKKAKNKKTIEDTGKKKKLRWTKQEISVVTTAFARHLEEKRLPSFDEISKLKEKYPEILKDRTRPTIKSWVDNQNKAALKGLMNGRKGKKQKTHYGRII